MFLERVLTHAGTHSKKLAVADPTRQLTYGQLTAFAQTMRALIIEETQNERVGVMLPGSSAFSGALLGCWWAERTAVSLNFLLQPKELQAVVADSGIDTIITTEHFAEITDQLSVKAVQLERAGLKRRMMFNMFKSHPTVPQVSDDQTAVLLYTSGTSGMPKGVELTYKNLFSNCRDCIAHAKIEKEHTLLSVLPPFHVFGLTAMTLLPLYQGMTTHYIPRFSPAATVRVIDEQQVSIFMAVPSMYAAIARVKAASAERFKSLYLAISGGEPLQESTARTYKEQFNVQLNEGYGLTETSPVVSINLPWDHGPGSVGKIIPNCNVRITDASDQLLGNNTDGEIQISGPNVMKGYFGKPEETAKVMTADGWFKTGDQGRLDDEGFLSITGRIKEMMIVGGENVFPGEIENVLVEHPAVAEAAVVPMQDPSRGELPVAFVILNEGSTASENDLRAHCREGLAGFKVPRQVHIKEDLPRGSTGKILKRALRDQLAAGS